MSAEMTDSPRASIKVRADNRVYTAPLLGGASVIAAGTVRLAFQLSDGGDSSSGAGVPGLIVGVLAVVVPLVWFAGGLALRRAKAAIVLEDGVLSVRDRWGQLVLHVLESDVTGLHHVRIPVDGHKDRLVLTSVDEKPLVLDTRLWEQEPLRRLLTRLTALPAEALVTRAGLVTWPVFRARFPGAKVPWRQVHFGWFTAGVVILTIAYIAFFVNLSYFV
ncbi:MAG: hypothetical protein HOY76_20755 [Streptomyces sp.]|nr:hypothetical protein [Streptomyces sp.]NUS16429.1 hypothetical protein [Streptomyces sp.]